MPWLVCKNDKAEIVCDKCQKLFGSTEEDYEELDDNIRVTQCFYCGEIRLAPHVYNTLPDFIKRDEDLVEKIKSLAVILTSGDYT